MIKSTRNGYCDHVQDIRNLSARVENSGDLGWVFGCSLGGELQFGRGEMGWERRRRRNRGRECRQMWAYNGFFRWNHRRITSVGDSISDSFGDSATSLYDYLSLNPSVILSVKSPDVTTSLHISRQTVYPVGETVGIYRRFCRRVYAVSIYRQILRRNYFRR